MPKWNYQLGQQYLVGSDGGAGWGLDGGTVVAQGLEGGVAVGQGLDGKGDAVQGLQGMRLSDRFRCHVTIEIYETPILVTSALE